MSDHGHYTNVHIDVDRALAEEFPNGIRRQEITVVMTDESGAPIWRALPPAFCDIEAPRARELAFELLMAAEVAERWEEAR
jgi:hypothetical protein